MRKLILFLLLLPSPSCPMVKHSVILNWTGTTGIYSVYRSNIKGGPYTKQISNLQVKTWTDRNVQKGKTYFYVATVTVNSVESKYSNEQQATVPFH